MSFPRMHASKMEGHGAIRLSPVTAPKRRLLVFGLFPSSRTSQVTSMEPETRSNPIPSHPPKPLTEAYLTFGLPKKRKNKCTPEKGVATPKNRRSTPPSPTKDSWLKPLRGSARTCPGRPYRLYRYGRLGGLCVERPSAWASQGKSLQKHKAHEAYTSISSTPPPRGKGKTITYIYIYIYILLFILKKMSL